MNLTTAEALNAATPLPFMSGLPGLPDVDWPALVAQRSYLVRYAQRKLRDPLLAEDAVHDVFEAVLSGRAVFAGRCALRSWLTAVLKNKIVDLVRQRASCDSFDDFADEDQPEAGVAGIECPHARPDELAEQREFLARVLERIDQLPGGLRDVMHLRVLQDQSTEDVCEALAISEENLFVRLHRARKQLVS